MVCFDSLLAALYLARMSKRQLTRRQQWRIEKIQQERLSRAERKVARDIPDDHTLNSEQPGRIIAHFGLQVLVENDSGQSWRCHFRANLPSLVVGDQVIFQSPTQENGTGLVSAIQPRHTELRRPDPYGNLKPVAANIDRLFVVVAPLPTPSSVLIDRYLVAAELSGITPVIVLNKTDLVTDEQRPTLNALRDLYLPLGYDWLEVSAHQRDGLNPLLDSIADRTVVLVGQSGVGKSSLVNALLPEAGLAVNSLSQTSGLGQHTTVTARLFDLPEQGHLIDSPGIREFGLWHISEEELLSGYRDLAELAGHCRFRNCSHRHEPGCALQAATEDGSVHPQRLENFFHIADTLSDEGRQRYQRGE